MKNMIRIQALKSGNERAYYWSIRQMRFFPMGIDEAKILIATKQAERIYSHPITGDIFSDQVRGSVN